MEPYGSLILTKLRLPAPRSRTITRRRLLQWLALEPGTDLVLVCAPAGYGKTTLLLEWARLLRQAGTSVAWYSLDESDNSLVTFCSYLVASLEQALGPESGLAAVSQVLRASPEVDLLNLLRDVINTVCASNRKIVVVLDDYHLIRTPDIHQAVEFLVRRRPENLHIAIGSRANPPLPLALLRAKDSLLELHAADLRFTDEETEHFLRVSMQLDITVELANNLAERVEGWAAGLQLAALSLLGCVDQENLISTFTGGHKRLAEYLLEEVVNQLPEELQAFLLYSSILERMSAQVCDAILCRENSAALLKQLEQSNLFVTELDEVTGSSTGENWYRYHHLFRDFLQIWLSRTQPGRAVALHRLAANWFAGHGSLREAAYHAFRCGDWSFAADFVEQHSFTLIIQSEIATIYEWSTAFPEQVLQSRPKLKIFQGLALAYRFQGKHRARVEACLQQASQAMTNSEDPAQAFVFSELTAVVHTFLAMVPEPGVDARKQLDLAESHLAGYPPGDSGRFPWLLIAGYAQLALHRSAEAQYSLEEALPLARNAGLWFGVVEATFHLARLAQSQGKLAASLNICQTGQAEFAVISQQYGLALPALGCLDIAAASVLIELDNLEEAEKHLRQGLERMGWGMNPYYLMTAYLTQFRLFEIRDQWEEAITCLDRLDTLWPDIHLITQGCRVEAGLRLHPEDSEVVRQAQEWLQIFVFTVGGGIPAFGMGPVGAAEAFFQASLSWARLQIALGPTQAAQSYLSMQLKHAREHGLQGREIELSLIEAQMLHKQGKTEQALKALENILAISRTKGYIRVFDQNVVLDDLIHLAARRGISPAYLDRILYAIRSTRSREVGLERSAGSAGEVQEYSLEHRLMDPLSERELEVLNMIASGATNKAIAERFVITVGTVKSHIHHIFGKLDACNRTEAVAQARKLGLIR